MICHQDYHIGQNLSGVAFLKILTWEAHINTRAMVMHIRAKLSALDSYILAIRCNITKFNAYVKDMINSLMARWETTQDLLTTLFKAYKAVTNCEFAVYICKKEDQYHEEGENTNTNLLMLQANNMFKTMFQAKTWNAPSP